MPKHRVPEGERERPWEANLCFTVKGENAADVERKVDAIRATARRVGAGDGFSDYEGPRDDA